MGVRASRRSGGQRWSAAGHEQNCTHAGAW